jgi:hypothetical protein
MDLTVHPGALPTHPHGCSDRWGLMPALLSSEAGSSEQANKGENNE